MLESRYLKDNIENIQKLLAIPALKNFETKSLGKLLRLSKIREYEDGERIIKEGDRDPWLYFLLSGKIKITKEGLEIGSMDKKGEIFGEMRIIDSMSRSATVRAIGKTSRDGLAEACCTGVIGPLPANCIVGFTGGAVQTEAEKIDLLRTDLGEDIVKQKSIRINGNGTQIPAACIFDGLSQIWMQGRFTT